MQLTCILFSLSPFKLSFIIFYRTLDLSFNTIRVIENLTALVELEELYLIQNNIAKIEGLTMLSSLTSLELGANKIRVCLMFYIMHAHIQKPCMDIFAVKVDYIGLEI